VAKLIYPAITSLDGSIADEHGSFDWGEPDEEVHAFFSGWSWSCWTSGASGTAWPISATA
jgi:hypothetical protein